MLFTTAAFLLSIPLSSTFALPPPQQALSDSTTTSRIPTVHESAIQARRILHLSSLGTFSTIFPTITEASSVSSDTPSHAQAAPADVSHKAIGLPDYFADCEFSTGNPTILELPIGTSFRNARASGNFTLSVRWEPPAWRQREYYSAVSLPRFAMIGYLEDMSKEDIQGGKVPECYARYHPDARLWFPGNEIHTSRWARLVVQEVYWIGGFGDRAYIGWIPMDMWRGITMDDVESIRLPGEE